MVLAGMVWRKLAALFNYCAGADDRGFHLDGLADTCDGVFSARSRDRMLEIMRDSCLGTHGGLALIFVVLAKILVKASWLCGGETDPIAGGSMCGQPRDCRIIDVSSSLCPGRRAWQCVHWQN